jgi:hypothetical protein
MKLIFNEIYNIPIDISNQNLYDEITSDMKIFKKWQKCVCENLYINDSLKLYWCNDIYNLDFDPKKTSIIFYNSKINI